MTKKVVLIALVLVVILVGIGIFLLKTMNNNKSSNSNNTQTVTKQITLSEVAKHTTASDCWMVINGNVYDVTGYIPGHPGGDQILLGCGKDATSMFNSRPSDGTSHSDRARSTLTRYQIGVLAK
jgi:cytochrome b involved in lipid metabolism